MIKEQIKRVLNYFLASEENLSLENRLFLSAIITGLFISFVSSIVSIILSSRLVVTTISLLSFFSLIILYYKVRIKRIIKPFKIPLVIVSFIIISIIWVADGGINGSNLFVGFVILILGLLIVPNKTQKYIFFLFITLIVTIYLIQLYRPDLISDFSSETIRWTDSLVTAIYSSFFIFLIIKFLHKNYSDEKRKAEESEDKFRSITENSADAIFISNQQGKYIYINKAVSVMLGFTSEEMKNKTITDISPPDKTEEYYQNFIRILRDGKYYAEIELLKNDGNYISTDLNAILLPDGSVYGSCRDITQRKQAELLLKESETKLRQLNADKDLFISILSHDLKSPFNNLLGLSEVLTEGIRKLNIDEIENLANLINKTALNTYALLEDILMWARAHQGKTPFKPHDVSIKEICSNILEINDQIAKAKNITINYLIEDRLNAHADPDMLKTIMRNLISNAIKFTDKYGVININAEENSENITISVSDNGTGIEPDILSKMFDISQVVTTKGTAKETGTGLGLLICKEFVEKHQGSIRVESNVGKGSKFIFTLPKHAEVKNDSNN